MKIRRKTDGTQAIDYSKVEAVICSCETMVQMNMAGAMVHQFDKMYRTWSDWLSLNETFDSKINELLKKSDATS